MDTPPAHPPQPTVEPPTPASPGPRPPFNELSVLFPLLTFYTAAYMALLAAEFSLRGALPLPPGLMPVYVSLLGAYAADKEVRRWAGRPEPPRKGSLFVYLWLLMFLAMFIITTFQPSFAMSSELGKVVLQVLGIFFGSRVSKYVHDRRTADGSWASGSRRGGSAPLPRGMRQRHLIHARACS
jgi:hypothetical protein